MKTNQRQRVIGDISYTLAKVVHGLMVEWKFQQVIAKNDGKYRGTAEGTWVPVRGIEIPCIYFLYGPKAHKSNVREKIK